ncbi:MAG: hypothetical protein L3J79_00220 [Candidatus Marinimicrobia bacterium]|nr:hypothetical protein [Candidatus Neomarinimicrobiota bacterium]
MKKMMGMSLLLLMTIQVFAGGMVTNSNQSAEYMRTLNRNASVELDAVYFNPAAVATLDEGLHLYLSNQTIFQTRTVVADFPTYNNDTFEGTTFAPAFPNLHLAYVMGAMAFSGSFQPIGGGGSAEFPDGLPAFEKTLAGFAQGTPASLLDAALEPFGTINGYSVDAAFNGSSLYLGFQGNFSYAISDMIQAGLGVRFISAKNTYEGGLENLTLNTSSGTDITTAIAGALLADKFVEAEKTGTTMIYVGSLNLNLSEALNLSLRYETMGALELTNSTTTDDIDMFPDGAVSNADIPAQASLGVGWQQDMMRVELSADYWFNTDVNWDGQEDKVSNNFEAGIGVEYGLSESLVVSGGYLYAETGATDEYQSDLSYSLSSNTVAIGGKYILSDKKYVSFGLFDTFYEDGKNYAPIPKNQEYYSKTSIGFALGYSHSF